MEESTSSENVWHKVKPEEQSELFQGESTTASVEANSTSLADIFDTAFTSTVDPSPQPRFPSGTHEELDSSFVHLYTKYLLRTDFSLRRDMHESNTRLAFR